MPLPLWLLLCLSLLRLCVYVVPAKEGRYFVLILIFFWLVCHQVAVNDPATGAEVSGVDYYFVMQDGSKFKVISDALK
jgi:hypothetical protein